MENHSVQIGKALILKMNKLLAREVKYAGGGINTAKGFL
jgi:hypothetical protein